MDEKLKEEEINEEKNEKTKTLETETLSELIKKLFINYSIFKTKINSLKYIHEGGAEILNEVREIGTYITVLIQTIIFYTKSNYKLNKENEKFLSEIYKIVENLPSTLYRTEHGWSPENVEKIAKYIDEFLSFLQEKEYIIRENYITLIELLEVEMYNLEKEKEERKTTAKNISTDIFIKYFNDCIEKIKNKDNENIKNKINQIKKNISLEIENEIIEIIEKEKERIITLIKDEIIEIYNKKILMLPHVNVSYMLSPQTSKSLFEEQNTFNRKMLEIINVKVYDIETIHTLFAINNILISYIRNKDIDEEYKVCKDLYESIKKGEENYQKKVYILINTYVKALQTTFRDIQSFSIIKII